MWCRRRVHLLVKSCELAVALGRAVVAMRVDVEDSKVALSIWIWDIVKVLDRDGGSLAFALAIAVCSILQPLQASSFLVIHADHNQVQHTAALDNLLHHLVVRAPAHVQVVHTEDSVPASQASEPCGPNFPLKGAD